MDTSLVHRRTPCTHTWGQFSVSRCTHLLNGHLPVWVPLLLLSLQVNVRYDAFHQNPTKFASIETIWRVSDLPQLLHCAPYNKRTAKSVWSITAAMSQWWMQSSGRRQAEPM